MGNTLNGTTNGSAATRAVALVGPAGTGKTSLAEALLFASGAITRQGSVEAGNTVGDASPEARARGSSTEVNLMHFDYLGDRFPSPAKFQTTREFLASMARDAAGHTGLPETKLSAFLSTCDLLKFAQGRASLQEQAGLIKQEL